MSNPNTVTLQLVAAVANGVALSQTPAGAGFLTLNGSLVTAGVATFDASRRVAITDTGNDAAVIFTLTGTNRYGNVRSETLTGLNANTVYSVYDYVTITSVRNSAGTVGAITVGTNTIGSTVWTINDFLKPGWFLSGGIVGPAGTTYTLEFTFDDPNAQPGGNQVGAQQYSIFPGSNVPPAVFPSSAIVNGTAIVAASGISTFNFANFPIFAHRLTILSGTGQVSMQSIQAGLFV